MNVQDLVVQDHRESNIIFVHSDVDDSGLTAAEFRVYAHFARRAGKDGIYPGIDSVAKVCKLATRTVIAAIKELEDRGMVRVSRVNGERNRYLLTRPSEWTVIPNATVSEPLSQMQRTVIPNATDRAKRDNVSISPKILPKGNPSENLFPQDQIFPTKERKDRCAVEELRAYAEQRGMPASDGEAMFDRCEATGWKIKTVAIKDWKAHFRTYQANQWLPSQKLNGNGNGHKPPEPTASRMRTGREVLAEKGIRA